VFLTDSLPRLHAHSQPSTNLGTNIVYKMRYTVGHTNGSVSREIYSMFVTPWGGHCLIHLLKYMCTRSLSSMYQISIRPRARTRPRMHARSHTCLFLSQICIMRGVCTSSCTHTLWFSASKDGLSKRQRDHSHKFRMSVECNFDGVYWTKLAGRIP